MTSRAVSLQGVGYGHRCLALQGISTACDIVQEERPAGGDDYGRRVYIPGTVAERQRLRKLEDDYRKVLEAKEHAEKRLQAKQEKVKELKAKEIPKSSLDEELAYLLRQQILQELLIEIAEQQALLISINEEEDNLIILMMLLD